MPLVAAPIIMLMIQGFATVTAKVEGIIVSSKQTTIIMLVSNLKWVPIHVSYFSLQMLARQVAVGDCGESHNIILDDPCDKQLLGPGEDDLVALSPFGCDRFIVPCNAINTNQYMYLIPTTAALPIAITGTIEYMEASSRAKEVHIRWTGECFFKKSPP